VPAKLEVTPVVARVSGNVYAMARDKVLRIDLAEDASPEEVEASVRAQLEAAGFDGEVSVHKEDGMTVMMLNPADPSALEQIEVNGQEIDLNHLDNLKGAAEAFMVARTPGMTDEDVCRQVEERLRALGISAKVEMANGQMRIKAGASEDAAGSPR
jgi:hypothetical protein